MFSILDIVHIFDDVFVAFCNLAMVSSQCSFNPSTFPWCCCWLQEQHDERVSITFSGFAVIFPHIWMHLVES
jgi:hypothetical protein